MPGNRELALRFSAGTTTRCKIAPEVENRTQINVGARVNATLTDRVTVFLPKNGAPPGPGTNSLATGLGTNWFDVPDSAATNSLTLPIDANNDSVFYRLTYP